MMFYNTCYQYPTMQIHQISRGYMQFNSPVISQSGWTPSPLASPSKLLLQEISSTSTPRVKLEFGTRGFNIPTVQKNERSPRPTGNPSELFLQETFLNDAAPSLNLESRNPRPKARPSYQESCLATNFDRNVAQNNRYHPYCGRPSVVRNSSSCFDDQEKTYGKSSSKLTGFRKTICNGVQDSWERFRASQDVPTIKLEDPHCFIKLEDTKFSLQDFMLKTCQNDVVTILDELFKTFGNDKLFIAAMDNFQQRMHNYNIKFLPFNEAERHVAKMIWMYSGKDYRKLRNLGLPLPSPSTVRGWIKLNVLQNSQ